ncbi:hypothetical protein CHS0354_002581 [Potamilus streckersoni]|uniref:NXPE C-terminal domain-containing protein n=1 Tax=Potamilus streckersoni TaxID=2493646 RepID=A0AAE0RNT9_9BIVA|nr:hypothetical protein CHS0354_002581 [Potamilus streckersoni]
MEIKEFSSGCGSVVKTLDSDKKGAGSIPTKGNSSNLPRRKIFQPTQSKIIVEKQTKSRIWVEDSAQHETPVTDHMTVSNASRSNFIVLNQKPFYRLGEEIRVLVELFNGYGHRRTIGGDMVRVWMRDAKHNASSAALVKDNENGSYTATLVAFWSGLPEIKAVLIHSKEVIDTYYRRRFKWPQVHYLSAIFEHPVTTNIKETTVCNLVDSVPKYTEICNLTRDNYDSPLYCVKPANHRLQCSDWTRIGGGSTWPGDEPHLTSAERFLLQPQNKATFLPGSIIIQVKKAEKPFPDEYDLLPLGKGYVCQSKTNCIKAEASKERLIESSRLCFTVDARTVWNRLSPIGYFYHDIWYDRLCTRRRTYQHSIIKNCIGNRSMYLLGDSTLRQWHYVIQDRINCTFVTDTWLESSKHRPATCVDRNLNFTLHWAPHGLPFATDNTPRRYFRPIATRIDDINGDDRVIIVINLFAHMMSFHSSVFYNRMVTIKDSIIRLFQRCPNATVAIKGPHYYSFEKQMYQSLWMLDKYADVYTYIMRELFIDLSNRVIYLDGMDMTISAETKHIHPSRQTAIQMVDDMFSKICPQLSTSKVTHL